MKYFGIMANIDNNKDRVLEPYSLYRFTQHTYAKFRATLAKKATISLLQNGRFW